MSLFHTSPGWPQRLKTALLLGILLCCAGFAARAQIKMESFPALGAPPEMIGDYKLQPVPTMKDWENNAVTSKIPIQNDNQDMIASDKDLYVVHGPRSIFPIQVEGDFFYFTDPGTVTLTFPDHVKALYLYAGSAMTTAPEMRISVSVNNNEESLEDVTIPTSERSRIFTFICDGESRISSVTISSSQKGVLFGGFGIAFEQ